MSRPILILVGALVLLGAVGALGLWQRDAIGRQLFTPRPPAASSGKGVSKTTLARPASPRAGSSAPEQAPALEVIAENLAIPWEIAFLPEGALLVTERPGRLLKVDHTRTVIPIEGVRHVGEGGLLGLALHPDFAENHWLYLYLTTVSGSGLSNRVERYRLEGERLTERTIIIENIPGAQFHDGGRIAFGPDGLLYVTTGDAGNGANAQNRESLAGKILRLNDDGTVPPDNPFGTAIYSLGHRNPQGLAWDDAGRLWSTEHGRSGVRSGFDEINLIEAGKNYGWPGQEGDETADGMTAPLRHSGADATWAPAGAAFLDGSVFFTGLRGEALYEARLQSAAIEDITAHFAGEFGRLRAAVLGPDGLLYVTTSNTDGRGRARERDDKIIRIDPAIFR
jgi:glucose/arabinose dehydrogenase